MWHHGEVRQGDFLKLATHRDKSFVQFEHVSAREIQRVLVRLICRTSRVIEIRSLALLDVGSQDVRDGVAFHEIG